MCQVELGIDIGLTTHLRGNDIEFCYLGLTKINELLILYFSISEIPYLTVLKT